MPGDRSRTFRTKFLDMALAGIIQAVAASAVAGLQLMVIPPSPTRDLVLMIAIPVVVIAGMVAAAWYFSRPPRPARRCVLPVSSGTAAADQLLAMLAESTAPSAMQRAKLLAIHWSACTRAAMTACRVPADDFGDEEAMTALSPIPFEQSRSALVAEVTRKRDVLTALRRSK